MNTPIFIFLAVLILGGLAVDTMFYDTEHLLFLTKKFMDFLDWIAFWR